MIARPRNPGPLDVLRAVGLVISKAAVIAVAVPVLFVIETVPKLWRRT